MSSEYLFDEDGDDYGYGMGDASQSSDGYNTNSQPSPNSNNTASSNNNNTNTGGGTTSGSSKFCPLSAQEILAKYINPLAAKVSRPLYLSRASAIFLLAACKWNDEQAITSYFEDEERTCKKAGFKPCRNENGDVADVNRKNPKSYTCSVCFDDETETMAGASLTCDHGCCKECWTNCLDSALKSKGDHAWMLTCPMHQCGLPAAPVFDFFGGGKDFDANDENNNNEDAAAATTSDENNNDNQEQSQVVVTKPGSMKANLEQRLVKLYVQNNNHMFARCSNPTCVSYLYCGPSRTSLPPRHSNNIVKCTCGQQTCVRCELPNHLPASCDHMTAWDSKEQADSANANWIVANTKQCPNTKCRKPIEKNQGCNHMTCSSCKKDFCWICLGDWSKHGSSYYNCNKQTTDPSRDAAANEIERYIHYYQRYRNHEKSKSLDGLMVTKARAKIEAMVRSGQARLHTADFWEKTAYTLIACRRTLMYSYVYAFYLPTATAKDKGEKELFEYQQGQLEHATEMLSEYVSASNSGAVSSEDVVAKMSVAQQMLKNLEEGVMK